MSGGYLRLHFHLNRNEKRDEKSISTAEANACWFSFPHEEERKKKVFFSVKNVYVIECLNVNWLLLERLISLLVSAPTATCAATSADKEPIASIIKTHQAPCALPKRRVEIVIKRFSINIWASSISKQLCSAAQSQDGFRLNRIGLRARIEAVMPTNRAVSRFQCGEKEGRNERNHRTAALKW